MKTSYYCKPGLQRFPLFPLKAVVLQIRQLHSFIFFLNFLKGVKFRGLKKFVYYSYGCFQIYLLLDNQNDMLFPGGDYFPTLSILW